MISFLFVDSERVWRGGQEQLLTLLPGLIHRGHEVHLICHPRTLLEERSRTAGAKVHTISFRRGNGIAAFIQLLSVLRRVHPQILAFNTPRPILLGNLASRLVGVRARIVFRRVNFPLRKNPIARLKYNWGINCIVAISESISCQLQTDGVPARRIRIIYEGMDLSLYPRREHPRVRRDGEPVFIGTVAHLSEEKGLFYLVEAAATIANARSTLRFIIVGDGQCRQALEEQVQYRGLESCFEFMGFVKSPAEQFSRFDIFVLPSLSEGLSSAILTAMATSLPVIATDVGGIPELVSNGENGLLVPARDHRALGRAIADLSNNPVKAYQMGQIGRRRMEEHFTLERKILETEQLCVSLLEPGAG
jgi:glycosyltransferase involved in cell wall biosynthesis